MSLLVLDAGNSIIKVRIIHLADPPVVKLDILNMQTANMGSFSGC
jgi:hypothetical protein